ncbi:MAG TPA: thiamine pyrophosphate-dependent enzyme [Anaerolineae bacterium]|nr:thiamine pyrophosphate-dependent enzyme [Anaerolineae bacterium]
MSAQLLLGNDAIALGLIRNGCRMVTAYPGTPSSEILAGVVKFKKQLDRSIYTEWSASEKVAFEVALAASWSGLRAATAMKQVGLNVAADSLFSAAYTGVVGGFVVVSCDDPGPQSSQTEQDSRLLALTAKVPVLDPSTPAEALAMIRAAFELSERHRMPVMLRPTTRVCHAVQSMEVNGSLPSPADGKLGFKKDPRRWAATPVFRLKLHHELNAKLEAIEREFESSPLNYQSPITPLQDMGNWRIGHWGLGIIASGVAYATAQECLAELGVTVPILKIGTPFPLPRKRVMGFIEQFERVLILEEPDACLELQIPDRTRVSGRLDGTVPNAGELAPEVMMSILAQALNRAGIAASPPSADAALSTLVQSFKLAPRRPRLCPGCSHRSAFFTIKQTFGPNAIYPGDIGCYTLGTNLRVVDTCVDMGASVTMATGFYHASRLTRDKRPIVATIGDSTFLHSGIVPLANAVHTNARFVLVILDNHTTAMTGAQPTPASDYTADGDIATTVPIPALVEACGVKFVRVADPYDHGPFAALLKEAHAFTQAPEGGPAVIIADRPCILYDPSPVQAEPVPVVVTEQCDGCRYCVEAFECPALVLRADRSRVDINTSVCVDCGQCIDACYKGFIVPQAPVTSYQSSVISNQ